PDAQEASMGPRRRCRGRPDDRAQRRADVGASMGPRRRCRGRRLDPLRHGLHRESFNGATTKVSWKTRYRPSRPSRWRAGFNGATTKVSWKTEDEVDRLRRSAALQWGHDEGVVEDTGRGKHPRTDRAASMGPR